MRERLGTVALALGALALFWGLFLPRPRPAEPQPSPPLSSEGGPNGYLAARRWLDAQQVPVRILRDRYTALAAAHNSPAPTGDLLIVTFPLRMAPRRAEFEALDDWIAAGNVLLVMAPLDDTPDWVVGAAGDPLAPLARITRLVFDPRQVAAPPAAGSAAAAVTGPAGSGAAGSGDAAASEEPPIEAGTTIALVPRGAHPLLAGVRRVAAVTDYDTAYWRASPQDGSPLLHLAEVEGDGRAALWLKAQGRGQIIVSALSRPFTNRELGQADNARLLANLVAWSRAGGGAVIFDDAHQGAVAFYDPQAFFADPRLHGTLYVLLALWLAFVAGARPLRPTLPTWRPVRDTALVVAGAGLLARSVEPADAALRLFENFFADLRHRLGRGADEPPPWDWLERQAAVAAPVLARLRTLHARTSAGRRVALPEVHALISRISGSLQ